MLRENHIRPTTTIPIVFGVGGDAVKLGALTSLARPGGNATGYNIFVMEVVAKGLGPLHELVPKAARIAVMLNPANARAETTLEDVPEAPVARVGEHVGPVASHLAVVAIVARVCEKDAAGIVLGRLWLARST